MTKFRKIALLVYASACSPWLYFSPTVQHAPLVARMLVCKTCRQRYRVRYRCRSRTRPRNPVLIRDVDNAVRQTVQGFSECGGSGSTCGGPLYLVPIGKLLVLETLTTSMQVPTGGKALVTLTINDPAVFKTELFFLTLESQGTFTGNSGSPADFFTGTHLVRIYAGPGSTVSFNSQTNVSNSTAVIDSTVSISGYLVNCGSGSGCPLP
jgi:hypothetical protein